LFAGMQGITACTSAYYVEVFAILLRMLPNKKGFTYRRYEGRRCTDYDHFYKVWVGGRIHSDQDPLGKVGACLCL
jgi:hypothetical protein